MSHTTKIALQLNISAKQVNATMALLDDGNTIPFIARYRKEATDNLDEEQIRQIADLIEKLRTLDARRETILKTIREQGKLTTEIEASILAAETRTTLEDLYLPYKPKRKTRASTAREKGLQPLADLILDSKMRTTQQSLDELAAPYLSEDVPSIEAAWAGARDIVAETISDHVEVRHITREKAAKFSNQQAEKIKKAEDPRAVYETYYEFNYRVDRLRPHQILAINRGEREKILRVKMTMPERDWRNAIGQHFSPKTNTPLAQQLVTASEDAAERLLLPSIARDIRRNLTEGAEKHAIQVFATNLRALLNQPPLNGHTVMGIDPGYRTGCKAAVVDATGKPLATTTIYPFKYGSQEKPGGPAYEQSQATLNTLIEKHAVSLITIGNGTASRETEQLVADLIKKSPFDIHYLIVNEAGASVYSASKLARAELPEMDVSMRSAVSIARRAQDPLAEMVKIDPQSIGVGMYQHDVDQKALGHALDAVVESVVNQIGVDVNTASPALLTRVAGLGPKVADNIVAHRDQHGAFSSREALTKVAGLGPKAFQQAAGFLRVPDGDNPLDASAIHPESYAIAEALLAQANLEVESAPEARESALSALKAPSSLAALSQSLETGIPTLEDIIEQLIQPGRDPRMDLPVPILRSDVLKMEDLVKGMQLKGTVRNVVDFGAFVDIGVKQDGLLHRSRLPRGTQLSVGDILEIEILEIEIGRGRISLGLAPAS